VLNAVVQEGQDGLPAIQTGTTDDPSAQRTLQTWRFKQTALDSGKYIYAIAMPTSIHLPKTLLEDVERRARHLKVSRNHYIVTVLEKELKTRTEWSPKFVRLLRSADADHAEFADVLDDVVSQRSSKQAVTF
jgi:hypothetical protein